MGIFFFLIGNSLESVILSGVFQGLHWEARILIVSSKGETQGKIVDYINGESVWGCWFWSKGHLLVATSITGVLMQLLLPCAHC